MFVVLVLGVQDITVKKYLYVDHNSMNCKVFFLSIHLGYLN
jgi:hypothetical protein